MMQPNAKDQPDHGIKYLRVGVVANTLCHGLGCIQLLGRYFHCWLDLIPWTNFMDMQLDFSLIKKKVLSFVFNFKKFDPYLS